MSDNMKDIKGDPGDSSDAAEKKTIKPLVPPAAAARTGILCTPEHRITDSSPTAAVPLHSPSFTSSPSADVASSEVSDRFLFLFFDINRVLVSHIFTIAMRCRRRVLQS